MNTLREVDGWKIAFADNDDYFRSLGTPSMTSIARGTGADMVILLAPGKTGDDISDDEIRELRKDCENARDAGSHP